MLIQYNSEFYNLSNLQAYMLQLLPKLALQSFLKDQSTQMQVSSFRSHPKLMKAEIISNVALNTSHPDDQKPRFNKEETIVIIDSIVSEEDKVQQQEKQKQKALLQKRKEEQEQLKALQQQFRNFSNLPKSILRNIRADVARYEMQNRQGKVYMQFNRYLLRRKLIKISLIGAAQLVIHRVVAINRIQQVLMKPESDKLGLVTIHVHNIEQYLFSELYDDKISKPTEQPYQVRINLLICHLYNPVNFKFRRNFLNKTMSIDFIKKATPEELTTDEVKQRDLSNMKMILHQSVDLEQFLRTTYKKEQQQFKKSTKIVQEKLHASNNQLQAEKDIILRKLEQVKKKIDLSQKKMRQRLSQIGGEVSDRLIKNYNSVFLCQIK